MEQPHGARYGLGLDEDTALVITNVGQLSSVGEVSLIIRGCGWKISHRGVVFIYRRHICMLLGYEIW